MNELKSLDEFRRTLATFQISLRDAQARVDSAQQAYTPLKTAADAAGDKLTPALKAQVAAVDSAFKAVYCDVGGGNGGGRGGFGGGRGRGAGAREPGRRSERRRGSGQDLRPASQADFTQHDLCDRRSGCRRDQTRLA
jgi:hypothetical protein